MEYTTVEAWRAHMEEGLTPEDWETLHRQAKKQPRSGPIRIPRLSLPGAPKPCKRTPEKHLEQMIKAGTPSEEDKRASGYTGRPYPGGYVCRATDGSVMVLQKGEGAGEQIHKLHPSATHAITITDPKFELVLKRAAIIGRAPSGTFYTRGRPGVSFTVIDQRTLRVEAKWEQDSSVEEFTCDIDAGLIGARWCLSVDYLLACCGRWPWRWEVGAEPERPGVPAAAAVCPHAIYWDADDTAMLIMPMRV